MLFVSAQLDAYISNDVWLRNARHANEMAKKLSDGLVSSNQVKLEYPTEANEVFVKLPKKMVEHLNSEEYMMSNDELDGKTVRLVTAWNTKINEVKEFLNTIFD